MRYSSFVGVLLFSCHTFVPRTVLTASFAVISAVSAVTSLPGRHAIVRNQSVSNNGRQMAGAVAAVRRSVCLKGRIYTLTAFALSQRFREIAIRMASAPRQDACLRTSWAAPYLL
jgi:hypothetical protein